ncbi:ASH1-related protein 2 [Actinidia rufa]|uniref:ASH1-related protein 2 n=1 Tax=Actinidia rufa TaxID=165716 RepID=A0A7J0FME2_9ERIC|nr:ASH1-related protein 2 [Actinidia rufa]
MFHLHTCFKTLPPSPPLRRLLAPPAPSPSSAAPPAAPPPSPPPTPPGSANPSAASGPRRRFPKNARSRSASSSPPTTYPPFPLPISALFSLFKAQKSPPDAARLLHSLASSLSPPASEFGFSPELTAALLAKDKLNAFGLMEPFSEDGEGSVRAYGIYPNASFFNHDCLPNACRFDYVDTSDAGGFNTNIIVRVIHDVPQRREICLGYFLVNLNYSERQRRLKEDYGFACACDRCKVETNWVERGGGGGNG